MTVQYNSENSEKVSIVIDLITDIDSKSFISKIKHFIEKNDKSNK